MKTESVDTSSRKILFHNKLTLSHCDDGEHEDESQHDHRDQTQKWWDQVKEDRQVREEKEESRDSVDHRHTSIHPEWDPCLRNQSKYILHYQLCSTKPEALILSILTFCFSLVYRRGNNDKQQRRKQTRCQEDLCVPNPVWLSQNKNQKINYTTFKRKLLSKDSRHYITSCKNTTVWPVFVSSVPTLTSTTEAGWKRIGALRV